MEYLIRSTSVIENIKLLKDGQELCKIRNKDVRGMKIYRRKFMLDIEDLKIKYSSSKNNTSNSINLADIAEVTVGHDTDTFKKLVKQQGTHHPEVDNFHCPKAL